MTKNLRGKCATFMNRHLEIDGAFCQKKTFHRFILNTDDTINGRKDYIVQQF